MTIEQHLLIQIYPTQKAYLTQMLEMICAIQENVAELVRSLKDAK